MTDKPSPPSNRVPSSRASSGNNDDPWGAHASTYDRVFAPLTGYVARSLFTMVEARLPNDARLLDIACGSGALLLPAIECASRRRARGGSDFVVGCDYSRGMVQEAQRKAARAHDSDVFVCEVQDGEALGYDDASFDAVFSCFGIFLFADRQAGWREAARVVAPGGLFATTTWMAPEDNEMFRVQMAPVMEALPARLKENATPPGWRVVADADVLKSEVVQAGFSDVDVTPLRTTFVLPSIEVVWQSMLDNPAGGALLRQCDDAELDAVKDHLIRALRIHAGGSDRPIVVEASCHMLTARRG